MQTPTVAESLKEQVEASRKVRDNLVKTVWQTNVAFRVQKPFAASDVNDDDDVGYDQIAVPADWSRTRAKAAALFSQLPRVSLAPSHPRYQGAVPIFEKIVNYFVPRAGALATMKECRVDAINAAGHCAAIAQYEATFAPQEVPAVDTSTIPPAELQQLVAQKLIPMVTVQRPVSERYRWYRISPAQLLRPLQFSGVDWQRSPWLGYDGTMPWERAKSEFKLTDADYEACCQSGELTSTTLAGDVKTDSQTTGGQVRFSDLYYWGCGVVPNEKRFDAIYRIVWVQGKDEPVIHEPYQGQRWVQERGEFVGATRLPIEVSTLTYVSDRPIPPSDSEIGRPQVLEQIRSRSQMILQRTRNIPIRTFDPNRVDPAIADLLMRGTWQGMIPIAGRGDQAITQISTAAFPREDFEFDRVANRDLDDAWSMSPNQMGAYSGGERSATEAEFVAGAYASVIGEQRADLVGMFLGLVETTMGLLQLHLDDYEAEPIVGQDGVQRLQQWDRSRIAGKFVAAVRQDATVLQDTGARLQQLSRFLNLAGKSGRVQIDPILAEMAALSGLDPAIVIAPPATAKPDPLNISFRYSGVEDVHDPLALALLVKAGQAPNAQDLQAAKQLLLDAATPLPPPAPPPQVTSGPVPQGALPPGQPNPDWNAMPRVTKRPEEIGG